MTVSTYEDQLRHQSGTDPENVVFVISSFEDDHFLVRQVFEGSSWRVLGFNRCRAALGLLSAQRPAVVMCDSELPDGNWKEILGAVVLLPNPPPLVVTCRLADERLWEEVLHLGGYDLLDKPLKKRAVFQAVKSAWRQWDRQREPITR